MATKLSLVVQSLLEVGNSKLAYTSSVTEKMGLVTYERANESRNSYIKNLKRVL